MKMSFDLKYQITIVVVTADRVELFQRCLDSLFLATAHCPNLEFQIRIVLNRPDSKTVEYVKNIRDKNIKIFNSMTKLFPGAARNLALSEIVSDWIYFIDDDAHVDRNFFMISLPFLHMKNYSFIGGPNISPPASSMFSNVTQLTLENPYICFQISKRYTRDKGITSLAIEESMILCNFFLRSDSVNLFRSNQVFEEHLAGGEENCLVQKLLSFGKEGLYVSDLFVWHERRKDLIGFCKQMFKYGYGRGLLVNQVKKPEIRHFIFLALLSLFIFAFNHQIQMLVFGYLLYCGFAVFIRALKRPNWLHFMVLVLIPFLHSFYILGILTGTFNGIKRDAIKFKYRTAS